MGKQNRENMENNTKIFAKFLGMEYRPLNEVPEGTMPGWYWKDNPLVYKGAKYTKGYICRRTQELNFLSWNKIMMIFEKIGENDFVELFNDFVCIGDIKYKVTDKYSLLDCTYKACLEYIKNLK